MTGSFAVPDGSMVSGYGDLTGFTVHVDSPKLRLTATTQSLRDPALWSDGSVISYSIDTSGDDVAEFKVDYRHSARSGNPVDVTVFKRGTPDGLDGYVGICNGLGYYDGPPYSETSRGYTAEVSLACLGTTPVGVWASADYNYDEGVDPYTGRAVTSYTSDRAPDSGTAYISAAPQPPATISTTSLPTGAVGTAYSASLAADGVTAPNLWSVTSGALPAGLSLSPTGTLSGTPTAAGTSSFTVEVIDAENRSATKNLSITVAAQPMANTTVPTISGTSRVGTALTARPGSWTPSAGAYTYQWLANGAAITGATGTAYTPTASVLGKRISVLVTASRAGYAPASVTSAQTAAVAPGVIANSKSPVTSGKSKVGKTLTASKGSWTPTGLTVKYRWLRDGRPISGATSKSYKLTKSSKSHRIKVRVTVSRAGYNSASKTSAATAKIT